VHPHNVARMEPRARCGAHTGSLLCRRRGPRLSGPRSFTFLNIRAHTRLYCFRTAFPMRYGSSRVPGARCASSTGPLHASWASRIAAEAANRGRAFSGRCGEGGVGFVGACQASGAACVREADRAGACGGESDSVATGRKVVWRLAQCTLAAATM